MARHFTTIAIDFKTLEFMRKMAQPYFRKYGNMSNGEIVRHLLIELNWRRKR